MNLSLHSGHLASLSALQWHGIAQLRQNVFVVEQDCPYPDLDERDTEPEAQQLWFEDPSGRVVATLRILHEESGAARRIGRVCTATDRRGGGVMAALITIAIDRCGEHPIEIEAQAHLQAWYERFGFVRTGDEFLEDGIPHVPMRRG